MIIWDEQKNQKLTLERNLSFEIFADLILNKHYYEILEHPKRKNQFIAIVPYEDYTYVIPFIIDENNNVLLKTIFPSRKYHKLYGGKLL